MYTVGAAVSVCSRPDLVEDKLELVLFWKAVVLGVVEGLTEFLPVSSTGHLIVVGEWLAFNDRTGKTFMVAIQLGAILAVCWEYRAKLASVLRGLCSEAQARRFAGNLVIAFLPAAVAGYLAHDFIKAFLFSPATVSLALIVGGVAILGIEYRYRNHRPQRVTVDQLDWRDALRIGCAQCLALFPGVSRSGATIMGGLVFGLSRPAATEFSFFLAIPTMFAATGYDLLRSWSFLHPADLPVFAIGFSAAFFSGLAAVRGLLRFVARHSFAVFAVYRIIFGGLLLWLANRQILG